MFCGVFCLLYAHVWTKTHTSSLTSPCVVCSFHPCSPLPLVSFLAPQKVQWSHLAALKSSNSAAPSPPPPAPPPMVSRSQSFSESGGVSSNFAQLHLRSQDPHHHHARPDPQPPLHHPQSQTRLERQASSEEVPPKVRKLVRASLPPPHPSDIHLPFFTSITSQSTTSVCVCPALTKS